MVLLTVNDDQLSGLNRPKTAARNVWFSPKADIRNLDKNFFSFKKNISRIKFRLIMNWI